MYYVVLAYEYALKGSIDEALQILEKGEKVFGTVSNNLRPAFQHIMTSTKVHLFRLKETVDADIVERVKSPFRMMIRISQCSLL
jgi:hypothetical protein